ncbi:hypothetical protein ACFV84_03600 [Kitasatospora sp. NPDC059811]|uniref:hypothetical protein n=1 Tax=Streptomycetaceae TaxID=2062 RepID=UPI0007AF8EBE|nr:hypothetical protein [Streptomyces sp. MJM8645]
MAVPQLIVVSLRGSGTPLLARITSALGYTPYGTMSGFQDDGDERPGPGEVSPLLRAAYGQDEAGRLLSRQRDHLEELETAFQKAVNALWRVWWTRLGQPITAASPVDPGLEDRLTRVPDTDLPRLLPGRGCWYVNSLDLERADAGFLRAWHTTARPPIVYHHRDVRDRIVEQIRLLSQPCGHVGSMPEHLVYRDIVSALPTMDARITLALTDPGFPGMREARRCQWLLRHPAVCVLTHEELAGPTETRDQALYRLLAATGHPDPAAALATLPGPRNVGAENGELPVGGWREHFSPDHERLLHQHHGDLLTLPQPHGAEAPRSIRSTSPS